MTFRVDITSEPHFADDDTIDKIRAAVADMTRPGVARGEEDVVVVSFDVESNGLGEALTLGERELNQRLSEAGTEWRYLQGGATAWAD